MNTIGNCLCKKKKKMYKCNKWEKIKKSNLSFWIMTFLAQICLPWHQFNNNPYLQKSFKVCWKRKMLQKNWIMSHMEAIIKFKQLQWELNFMIILKWINNSIFIRKKWQELQTVTLILKILKIELCLNNNRELIFKYKFIFKFIINFKKI